MTDFRFLISGVLALRKANCKQAVLGNAPEGCAGDEISQLYYRIFKKEKSDEDLEFEIDAYNFAQDEKVKRGLIAEVQLNYLRVLGLALPLPPLYIVKVLVSQASSAGSLTNM